MKIKNYFWAALILGLIAIPSAAQPPPRRVMATQGLTAAQRTATLNTNIIGTCAEKAPTTARFLAHDARVFSPQRVAKSLNGVWIGRVVGEYDRQLMARDGFLNVDYYMIVDIKRGEAFVYEEVTDKRSGGALREKMSDPNAPNWTYVWCSREQYKNPSPRQIHEFIKVSDDVNDAREMLNNSFGVRIGNEVILSEVWKELVDTKYFDDPKRALAYAGVLFKPITIGNVESGKGTLLELRMVGEYRGNGQTASKFIPKEPIHNVEGGRFVGLITGRAAAARVAGGARQVGVATSTSGDFLAASFSLGNPMVGPKSDADVAVFSNQMAFDKVIIGLGEGGIADATPATKPASPVRAQVSRRQQRAHKAHR